jgi:hypothetical protein
VAFRAALGAKSLLTNAERLQAFLDRYRAFLLRLQALEHYKNSIWRRQLFAQELRQKAKKSVNAETDFIQAIKSFMGMLLG